VGNSVAGFALDTEEVVDHFVTSKVAEFAENARE
jgi:hypothetical protein